MKKPNLTTVYDVLKDNQFRTLLDESINEMVHQRNEILKGFSDLKTERVNSSAFVRLDASGSFTVDFLVNEFLLIEEKKSILPANDRNFICNMVLDHIRKTVDFYKN